MDMDTYEMSNVDIFREMFIQVLTFHDAHGSSYSFLFASLEILSTFQFIYFLFSFFFFKTIPKLLLTIIQTNFDK